MKAKTTDGFFDEVIALTRELCGFRTNIVSDDNDGLFQRLQEELPFVLHRYPSGENYNGWVIPPCWEVERALITRDGDVIFDGTAHPLAVGMMSRSFQGRLSFDELKQHLVTSADIPGAYVYHCIWQIRYWDVDWALCVPYDIYCTFGPGTYEVDLITHTKPGNMIVAEYEHRGRSDKTILFNTNTCHPTQANDGFCAVAVLVRLFQWLQGQETYYTYRLILGPEHMGSVHYMKDKSATEIESMVACMFLDMPGNVAPLSVTSTFLGGLAFDTLVGNVVRATTKEHKFSEWRQGAGNDETVWEAPGHEIPTIEFSRAQTPDFPYPEYHSSLDNPDLIDEAMVTEVFEVLKNVVATLENNATVHRHFNSLICLSNPEYDLYFERHDPAIDKGLSEDDEKWGRLLDFVFRYFDGSMTVVDIADQHDLPFDDILRYLKRFEEKKLISLEFSPLDRPPLTAAWPHPDNTHPDNTA